MTGIVAKVDALAAEVVKLAEATGREVEHVFDEIIAHVEGKTKEAEAPKSGDVADVKKEDTGNAADGATGEIQAPGAETPPSVTGTIGITLDADKLNAGNEAPTDESAK